MVCLSIRLSPLLVAVCLSPPPTLSPTTTTNVSPTQQSPYLPALSELIFLTHLGRLVITLLSRNSFHFITLGEKYWTAGGGLGAVFHFTPISVSGEARSGELPHWASPRREVSGVRGSVYPFDALCKP